MSAGTAARVLLVEDDPALAEMFALLPRLAGHQVNIARDGDEAVKMTIAEVPDLVLLDVRLPHRTGLEVLEHVRQMGYTGTVWMLTNYTQGEMIAQALAGGASRWLVKSNTSPKMVTDLIQEWAASKLGGDTPPSPDPTEAGFPTLVADDSATYVAINPAAATLLEARPTEVVGRKIWDFTPRVQLAVAEELWQRFVKGGSDSGPYVVVTKNGKVVPVRYRAVANVSDGLHVSVLTPEESRLP